MNEPIKSYLDMSVPLSSNEWPFTSNNTTTPILIGDSKRVIGFRPGETYKSQSPIDPSSVGYWIKSKGAEQLNLTGEGVNRDTVSISAGHWHLMGSLSDTVDINTMLDSDNALSSDVPIYEYNTHNKSYEEATEMAPGSAYWVYGEGEGNIMRRIGLSDQQANNSRTKHISVARDQIIFTSQGTEKVIYYAEHPLSEPERNTFRLPPQASGIPLDVRTASGFRIADGDSAALSLNADQYPVQVRLQKNAETNINYKINLVGGKNQKSISLIPGQQHLIKNEAGEVYLKRISQQDEELTFTLSPNYPNPFNSTTTIPYEIPEQINVSVNVYNILGQQVRTLINEVQQPGSYTLRFAGSSLSSGIYFLRIMPVTLPMGSV